MKRKPDSLELSRLAIQHVARRELRPKLPPTTPIRQHQLSQQIARKQWRRRLSQTWYRGLEYGITFLLVFNTLFFRLLFVILLFSPVGILIVWLFQPTFAAGFWPGIKPFFLSQNIRLYVGIILTGIVSFLFPFFLLGLPLTGYVKARRRVYATFKHQRLQREWYVSAYAIDYTHFLTWWMSPNRLNSMTMGRAWSQTLGGWLVIQISGFMIGLALIVLPLVLFKVLLVVAIVIVETIEKESVILTILISIGLAVSSEFIGRLVLTHLPRWLRLPIISPKASIPTMAEFLLAIQKGESFSTACLQAIGEFLRRLKDLTRKR